MNNTHKTGRKVVCKNKHSSKVRKQNVKHGAGLKKSFKNIVSLTKRHIKKFKPKCKKAAIDLAIAVAKELTSDSSSCMEVPRVIPVPKVGGVLPLIPIFAGLSAVGGFKGGATSIVRALNAIKSFKKQMKQPERDNRKMELYLGRGLHLKEREDGLKIVVNKKN